MVNPNRSNKLAIFYFSGLILLLSLSSLASAQQKAGSEDRGQEASASQAQATMASLFGRGATMPEIPHMGGTIALPSFDSKGMKIDENAVRNTED